MTNKTVIIVNYNWLAERAAQLNVIISSNQSKDPENKNQEFVEQNLMNVGAMQMINEIIDNFPAIELKEEIKKTK